MIEIASKMVLCLVIASCIGFVIGFLVARATIERRPTFYNYNQDFKVHGNIYNRPIILSRPRPTGKDDLKQISGIDEKTEEELNQLGIFHFDQVSKWSKKNCDWVSEYLALDGRIKEEKWVEQAVRLTNKR